ncbi:hypothetical protein U1Q18_050573 [Sarracenia purpurea var. burkii]
MAQKPNTGQHRSVLIRERISISAERRASTRSSNREDREAAVALSELHYRRKHANSSAPSGAVKDPFGTPGTSTSTPGISTPVSRMPVTTSTLLTTSTPLTTSTAVLDESHRQ